MPRVLLIHPIEGAHQRLRVLVPFLGLPERGEVEHETTIRLVLRRLLTRLGLLPWLGCKLLLRRLRLLRVLVELWRWLLLRWRELLADGLQRLGCQVVFQFLRAGVHAPRLKGS
jgi:hypothetical protein